MHVLFERATRLSHGGERSVDRKCVEPQRNLGAVTVVASSLSGVATNKENLHCEPALKSLRFIPIQHFVSFDLSEPQVKYPFILSLGPRTATR